MTLERPGNIRRAIALFAGLALAFVAPLTISTPAAAAGVSTLTTVNFTLYGSRAGWGNSTANITSPGPNLTATLGDKVNLTLYGADSHAHAWYLDYNNDSMWNQTNSPWEPGTNFSRATGVVSINFTVNHTGTFKYRSVGAPDALMVGNFTVLPAGGGGPGAGTPPANVVLVVAVAIVVIGAVIAIAGISWRRRGKEPPAPPPPES